MQGQTKLTKSSFTAGSLLLAASFLLAGCQTTDFDQLTSNIMNAITPSQSEGTDTASQPETTTAKTTAAVSTATPSNAPPKGMKKSTLNWGLVQFVIGAGGTYDDYWSASVFPTSSSENFIGAHADKVAMGRIHAVQLWPGEYRVRLTHNSQIKADSIIKVEAGKLVRLTAEYGVFSNSVITTTEPVYNDFALMAASTASYAKDTYLPVIVEHQGQWLFEFRGPQVNGQVAGNGTITVLRDGSEVAVISNANITPDEITGKVTLTGEGVYQGRFNRKKFEQIAGTKIKWKNGKTFEGTFEAVVPKEGKLTQLSGSVWEGEVDGDNPSGEGRFTNTDGSWVQYSDYAARDSYVGLRDCGPSPDVISTCAYYKGEKLASEAELNAKIAEDKHLAELEQQRQAEQRRIAQIAAAKAAEEAAKEAEVRRIAAAEQAAREAAAPRKPDDCTTATGTFSADGNLTQYTMNGSGSGSGHFRQRTYGSEYQFDIDFYFNTSANSISFDYGEGIYSDAGSGAILQRTSIPNGSANCTFNGRVLTIDGKEFVKR